MSLVAAVQGKLVERGPDYALIAVGGVTLCIFVPGRDLETLGALGVEVALSTHLVVREDDLQLYGFASDVGRWLFSRLLGVSGVGPRAALSVLSVLPAEGVVAAIVAGDTRALSQAPGVGSRTADRIVVDLREKLEERFGSTPVTPREAPAVQDSALKALVALGYSAMEARQVLSEEHGEGLETEERVRRALRRMGGGTLSRSES